MKENMNMVEFCGNWIWKHLSTNNEYQYLMSAKLYSDIKYKCYWSLKVCGLRILKICFAEVLWIRNSTFAHV